MAPADTLSPVGSSTYQSNTMYVGDGTWDSSKNDFLLPNLVGLNFETMRYNGMGNRFSTMHDYHSLIRGHAIIAVIVFLFILPFSVMFARFRAGTGVRFHIYLNILALFLSTVVFILGFFAVGPRRSLTNPHHGIGLAIYVLILVQTMGGAWVRGKLRKHVYRRPPVKLMLHQWLGRAIVLLGIAQVPLGLTLYGSPKWTFVLYTLWMTFLLIVYFILSHRAGDGGDRGRYSVGGGGTTVITEERKSGGGIGRILAPLAAGGAIAALLSRRRNRSQSRDRSRRGSVAEVIPSRRGSRRGSRRESESFIEEEKYDDRRKEGGMMDKLFKAGAVLGAGALAKSWWDRRRQKKEDEEYSAVAPDTPSRVRRHRGGPHESVISDNIVESRRAGHDAILPGPGDPMAAAAAISATDGRPRTPAPIGRPLGGSRRNSSSSMTYSYDTTASPSRRESTRGHPVRNTVLAGIGLGWLGKKFKDRRDRKEQDRLDEIREREREDERRLEDERRHGHTPSRYTGDGIPPPRMNRRTTEITTDSSDLSSDLSDSRLEHRRGTMPPLAAGGLAGATIAQSRSRHDIVEPVPMPTVEPRQSDYHESGSEAYFSAGGKQHRRHSSGRGRAAEVEAASAGLALAAEEEERRRRERSRNQSVASPPVSVKVKMHGDKNHVTLRRLTEEEAAAERNARSRRSSRRRADSASSMSGAESASRNRYRRDASTRREAEILAEKRAEAGVAGPSTPLSPPRPAFAKGRPPKDSSYYSGPPAAAASFGSPESHGTWSAMSPSGTHTDGGEDAAADRRRRRRLERNQRMAAGTVDYT